MKFLLLRQAVMMMIASCVFSADSWDGDMMVVYYAESGKQNACFEGKKIPMRMSPWAQSGPNVYDKALGQMCAGYYFLPGITVKSITDLNKWKQSGVRQFICGKQPFFSPVLQNCLIRLESVLRQKESSFTGGACTESVAKECFSLKGKTRLWTVVEKSEVKENVGSIHIMFRGETDVLEGVWCDQGYTVDKQRSLADVEDCCWLLEGMEANYKKPYCRDVPAPNELLRIDISPSGLCDCGILYFPGDGRQLGLLADTSAVRITRDDPLGKSGSQKVSGDEVLGELLQKSYCLKRESCAQKNLEVLCSPAVREVACVRQEFSSHVAEYLLAGIAQLPSRDIMHGEIWRGLSVDTLRSILQPVYPQGKKIVWSILDLEGLREIQMRKKCAYAKIVLFPQGEGVALCGKLAPSDTVINACGETLYDLILAEKNGGFGVLRYQCGRRVVVRRSHVVA